VSFTTVSSWDASHDPLGAWSSTYWAIPDFVGAVRASFKVRCGAVADATSFTARISWDTGATYDQVVWFAYEGETVYLVTPIKAVASGWDRVQFQIVHDDTGAVSFDVEASIEVWPG
jgi:hypothetical protein